MSNGSLPGFDRPLSASDQTVNGPTQSHSNLSLLCVAAGKAPMPMQGKDRDSEDGSDRNLQADLKRLRSENAILVKENQRLSYEIYQVTPAPRCNRSVSPIPT